jgi:hypothetical protein
LDKAVVVLVPNRGDSRVRQRNFAILRPPSVVIEVNDIIEIVIKKLDKNKKETKESSDYSNAWRSRQRSVKPLATVVYPLIS